MKSMKRRWTEHGAVLIRRPRGTPRTRRIEITFRISVSTNSVMPTAKMVLYSIDPVGTSPVPVAAMNARHRLDGDAWIERQGRLLTGRDQHDDRLADRARDGQDEGCGDAGDGRRHDHLDRGLHLVRAERVGALAQFLRHRAHRVVRKRRHRRDQHDAHHEARTQGIESVDVESQVIAQQRRHEGEREVAEHDRRDPGQDLECRLHRSCAPAVGVLRSVDGRTDRLAERSDRPRR